MNDNEASELAHEVKLIVLGDSGTDSGGVEWRKLHFRTVSAGFDFTCLDCPASRFREGYLIGAGCAIVMFDVTDRSSYRHAQSYIAYLRRVCGSIPIAVCGNKVDDDANRKVKPMSIRFKEGIWKRIFYYEISAKSNYHWEVPFRWFANLINEQDENFLPNEMPQLATPEIALDLDVQQRNEAEAFKAFLIEEGYM